MALVGFLQAQNCTNLPSSWRHPQSRDDSMSADYYQEIARILEAGKFHMAFFDDRLAMPDRYGNDHRHTVEYGIRCVKMDPIVVLTTMGMVTEKLGLASTCSTTYYEPFDVARRFATLDLMTGGRAAWNVVTSVNDGEALNMGKAAHLEHDLRYDRADEFMEVVLGHWDTWEDDSIAFDRESGTFADPGKVHRLDHKGRFFSSRGPFTVPRSPQGHPVIIQAGQSGRGKEFAARWGELLFVIHPHLATAQKHYRELKESPAGRGREITIAAAFYPVVAETQAEAEDRFALVDGLARPIDSLVLLSEVLNFDFAAKAPDEPLSDDELRSMTGIQAVRDRVIQLSGKPNPTVGDFLAYSGRGTLREFPTFVGTAAKIADQMEQWFAGSACDGFVIAATHVPGTYEDFVRLVVPELQRRGLFQREYQGDTLRANLGLPRPQRGYLLRREPAKLEALG
jgi:FMN-dependent oxidoreductase (nitrilotriacetate monooxygenase family)